MTRPRSSLPSRLTRGKTGDAGGVAQIVAIGLFCLVAAILAGLWWWREGLFDGPDVAYTQFGPMRVSTKGYGILTTLSLQTSASDVRWVEQNTPLLQQTLEQTLVDTDVPTLRNPDGLQHLQDRLEQATNAALPGSHVQRVFVTDLVYQFGDE